VPKIGDNVKHERTPPGHQGHGNCGDIKYRRIAGPNVP